MTYFHHSGEEVKKILGILQSQMVFEKVLSKQNADII